MAIEKTYQEVVNHLRQSGFKDVQIATGMQKYLPGGFVPSLNSVRRWRYGKSQPSAAYAAVLEMFYTEAKDKGLLK